MNKQTTPRTPIAAVFSSAKMLIHPHLLDPTQTDSKSTGTHRNDDSNVKHASQRTDEMLCNSKHCTFTMCRRWYPAFPFCGCLVSLCMYYTSKEAFGVCSVLLLHCSRHILEAGRSGVVAIPHHAPERDQTVRKGRCKKKEDCRVLLKSPTRTTNAEIFPFLYIVS